MPVVVYNYLDKPQTVELELKAADWFRRLDVPSSATSGDQPTSAAADPLSKLELKPGEVRSLTLPIKVLQAGSHALEVTARGSGVADAMAWLMAVLTSSGVSGGVAGVIWR